jgi:hypothetical protein
MPSVRYPHRCCCPRSSRWPACSCGAGCVAAGGFDLNAKRQTARCLTQRGGFLGARLPVATPRQKERNVSDLVAIAYDDLPTAEPP